MLFIVDESLSFTFTEGLVTELKKKSFALAAGVMIQENEAQDVVSYFLENHSKDGHIVKGSSIADDLDVEKILGLLIGKGASGAVAIGDHQHTSMQQAVEYQRGLCFSYIDCLKRDHDVYRTVDSAERAKIIKAAERVLSRAAEEVPQEFYKMLMILKVVAHLLVKLLKSPEILNSDDFSGVTVIIDSQSGLVPELINSGIFWPILFIEAKLDAFHGINIPDCYVNTFENKRYLNVKKLVKEIRIVSDKDCPQICIADMTASFISKALTGVIKSHKIADMIGCFFTKVDFFHFNPVTEYIDVNIPEELSYAYEAIVRLQ